MPINRYTFRLVLLEDAEKHLAALGKLAQENDDLEEAYVFELAACAVADALATIRGKDHP